jgi:two-component system, NarL family, nitrate/nitrite response regulator NarL
MLPADCHPPSTCWNTSYSPAPTTGTVLLITKARLLRDMIGRILTAGGYVLLGEDRSDDEAAFGPPPSDSAWKADLVIVIYERDENWHNVLKKVRHAANGKIVLLLRENAVEEVSREILEAVDGVLNDEVSAESLLQALKVIRRGERVVPRYWAQMLAKQSAPDHGVRQRDTASLSPREKEIVLRLVRGESNKVIGHGLRITEATVKVHLKAILRKISVQNRTQVAIWAVNNGFDQNLN